MSSRKKSAFVLFTISHEKIPGKLEQLSSKVSRARLQVYTLKDWESHSVKMQEIMKQNNWIKTEYDVFLNLKQRSVSKFFTPLETHQSNFTVNRKNRIKYCLYLNLAFVQNILFILLLDAASTKRKYNNLNSA